MGWVLWHLPLFVYGFILWPDVIAILAASFVLAWLVASTESVLLAMFFHSMDNAAGELFGPMFQGTDSLHQALHLALIWALLAGFLVWRASVYRRQPGRP